MLAVETRFRGLRGGFREFYRASRMAFLWGGPHEILHSKPSAEALNP